MFQLLALIENTLTPVSIGGFVVAVLAGTSAVYVAKNWWRFAALAAIGTAAVHVGLAIDDRFPQYDLPDPGQYTGFFLYYTVIALIVAGVGQLGYRTKWPGPLRIASCLVADVAFRYLAAVGILTMGRRPDPGDCL